MIDADGGCYDGLEAFTANRNQGAESTLAYCASLQLISMMPKHQERQNRHEQQPKPKMFDLHVSRLDPRGNEGLVSAPR